MGAMLGYRTGGDFGKRFRWLGQLGQLGGEGLC